MAHSRDNKKDLKVDRNRKELLAGKLKRDAPLAKGSRFDKNPMYQKRSLR